MSFMLKVFGEHEVNHKCFLLLFTVKDVNGNHSDKNCVVTYNEKISEKIFGKIVFKKEVQKETRVFPQFFTIFN